MKFTKRIRETGLSPSLALAERVRVLRSKGREIINFGKRPDVPQHIKKAAIESLMNGGSPSEQPWNRVWNSNF